jgi:hypothetical protein
MDITSDNNEHSYIMNTFYITMILHKLSEIKTWKIHNNKELIIILNGDFYPYPEKKNKKVKDVCIKYNYTKDSFQIITRLTSVEFKKDDQNTNDHYELLKSLLPRI